MSTSLQDASCWRVISTRMPSADLFEGIADYGEWEAVAELENLWNERSRGGLGNLATVPKSERAYGPGSSYLMAPFAYRGPGRFGDGSYGVLYAGLEELTALAEVAYHRAEFMRASANRKENMDLQVLGMLCRGEMEDLRGQQAQHPDLYDEHSWQAGQSFGAGVRDRGLDGILYSSVRRLGGECVAGFKPNVFHHCHQVRCVQFFWDGERLHGPGGVW